MVWIVLGSALSLAALVLLWRWYRGWTVLDLVRQPPAEADLPEIVTILSYLHHELVKHRLPLVRTVAGRGLEDVRPADVETLKQAVTGQAGRPSVVAELDQYLSGLRRAAGQIGLNFWRDPMMRRARRACRIIQDVADGLGSRTRLRRSELKKLRRADHILDDWFRPRLQALRNSVLLLELSDAALGSAVRRAAQEVGAPPDAVELPHVETGLRVRMLRDDFDLVLRNLIRNALKASEAAGDRRVAVSVQSRVDFTGEESVLVRVYDTNDQILTRDQLYGGELGRGLNLVTTTLRRYDGAISCKKSDRDGFGKYLEVRLFRAMADDDGAVLLNERDALGIWVPVLVVTTLLLSSAGVALGAMGVAPDPVPYVAGLWRTPVEDESDSGRVEPSPADARAEAVEKFFYSLEDARARASAAAVTVPAPDALFVDKTRCSAWRVRSDRRLELECKLVRYPEHQLLPPVVVIVAKSAYDLTLLEVTGQEMLRDGDHVREADPDEECVAVTALAPQQPTPQDLAEIVDDSKRARARSRIIVDYRRCLAVPRYPLRVRLKLARPPSAYADLEDVADNQPTRVDLKVNLRDLTDADRAYLKISNDETWLPERRDRRRFVREMARQVSAELLTRYEPETMSRRVQVDYALALYFGWVRPSLYEAIDDRLLYSNPESRKTARATEGFCRLDNDARDGFERLGALDEKSVEDDVHRSEYYLIQTRLWVRGNVGRAKKALVDFQQRKATDTDFVQGARLYAAMLMTLGTPPEPQRTGLSAALGEQKNDPRAQQVINLLKAMRKAGDKPPRKGSGHAWDRVKLIGMRTALADRDLDEGVSIDDALCAFRLSHPGWVDAMAYADTEELFGHCPGFVLRRSILDTPDDDDAEESPDGPTEPDTTTIVKGSITAGTRAAQGYIGVFTRVFSRPAIMCDEANEKRK